jgi:ligand-binding sensor protein
VTALLRRDYAQQVATARLAAQRVQSETRQFSSGRERRSAWTESVHSIELTRLANVNYLSFCYFIKRKADCNPISIRSGKILMTTTSSRVRTGKPNVKRCLATVVSGRRRTLLLGGWTLHKVSSSTKFSKDVKLIFAS